MPEKETSIILGRQQSPINIRHASTIYAPDLKGKLHICYENESASGEVKDENFIIDKNENHMLMFQSVSYRLEKLHFHAHCEHKLDCCCPGKYELHLVHRKECSTDYLVLSIFFNENKDDKKNDSRESFRIWNDALKPTAKSTKRKKTTEKTGTKIPDLALKDFVNADMSRWFLYEGSLTSYPFSQDVTWIVNLATDTINPSDIDKLKHTEQHVRDVQPLNRRFVLRNFDGCE